MRTELLRYVVLGEMPLNVAAVQAADIERILHM